MLKLLEYGVIWLGGRLALRDATAEDGHLVAYWRNSPRARAAFHSRSFVTPASHAQWMAGKNPLDCVYIAERHEDGVPVGMTSLTLDSEGSAECGRMFIDERFLRQGYGTELEFTRVAVAFEFFQVESVWLEVYADNEPMMHIHGKLGWTPAGVDVPGHKGPHGQVYLLTLDRQRWATLRASAIESYGWDLPAWTP